MKKTIFCILTVLMALSLVTCDLFEQGAEPALLNADAPGFVTLSIKTDENLARALDLTQAKAGVDFYEVVFQDIVDTLVVRDSKAKTSISGGWTVSVPIGKYDGTDGKAVLFAGKLGSSSSPNILLAIGTITASNGGGTLADITAATTSITFGLTSIKTDLANLEIEDTSAGGVGVLTRTTLSGTTATDGTLTNTPVFVLKAGNSHTATYVFTVPYTSLCLFSPLPVATATAVTVATGNTATVGATNIPVNGTGILVNTDAKAVVATPDADPKDDIITLTIEGIRGNTAGLCKLDISIPVHAILTGPESWVITGGLQSTTLDAGTATSPGGAILLSLSSEYSPSSIVIPTDVDD